jgi:GTP-binding protein
MDSGKGGLPGGGEDKGGVEREVFHQANGRLDDAWRSVQRRRVKIKTAEFAMGAPDLEGCPPEDRPEFAFIGRSNVGKSSLLNLLVGRKSLARVSSTPGATRMINFFTINDRWMMVDLPGYGYAKLPQKMREGFQRAVSDYLAGRGSLRCVIVLIDARHSPQKLDLDFCDWLAVHQIPFVLAFTKADKVKAGPLKANVADFLAALAGRVGGEPQVFVTSAQDRRGRDELLGFIGQTLEA